MLFAIFFWLIPAWIESRSAALSGSIYAQLMEQVFARRLRLVKGLGVTLLLVCAFVALWNYHKDERMGSSEQRASGILARLLSWLLR